jgi:flagellar biosynthetic protein FliR
MPLFGERLVPIRVKLAISFFLALLLFPVIPATAVHLADNVLDYSLQMAGEILIGVILGLAPRLILAGIQLAGQVIGFQMGFAIANIVDPVTSAQVSIIAELYYLIAMLMFLAFDFHHILIGALVESFTLVSPLGFVLRGELVGSLAQFSGNLFLVSVKIGAPVIVALTLLNVSLGIVSRTVPQINIFIVGFPVQIMVGLLFIGLGSAMFSLGIERFLAEMSRQLLVLLRLLA